MRERCVVILLILALLTGCAPGRTEVEPDPPPSGERTLAYVPLDDRPDNLERPVYLAESLDYTVLLPDTDTFRTRLDGQPRNGNGTPFGDRAALYEWVLAREAEGCDRYVLSVDQLMSGGLVNSRCFRGGDVILSDGTVIPEEELLPGLLETLAEDGNNTVWLLDSVMRLAPTVGYAGGGLEEYEALRAYGMEPRPEIGPEALSLESVVAEYRNGRDGGTLDEAAFRVTEEQVADYLAARERKLRCSAELQTLLRGGLSGNGRIRVLTGVDDSSEAESIQKNEIALLRSLQRSGDALLAGVDDLAFKAIARMYLDETGAAAPRADVSFFGGTEDRPACAYDSQPLEEVVEEHLRFFGMERAAGEEAELRILILTQPADPARKESYWRALIDELLEEERTGRPVILIDAGNGQYGTAFHRALTEEAELGRLLSYAGFLDMAIVTGTALSHGAARYAYLLAGGDSERADRAFRKTLADSVIKDFCYKNAVRGEILAYVREELGGSADNFWTPPLDLQDVTLRLEEGMETAAEPVIRNLERSNLITEGAALRGGTEGLAGWGGIELSGYRFPWDRAFEITMEISLGPLTEPHEQRFGVWIR